MSKLRRAAEFMRGVRRVQAGKDKFIGRNYLSPTQQQAITNAISGSSFVSAVKDSANTDIAINYLAERFEELARRQGTRIDAELRPAMVKLLAAELWVNHKALNEPSEKLISTTLHQGAIAPELLSELGGRFPHYIISFAMTTAAPASPRAFLQRVSAEIEQLAAESEFKNFADQHPSALYVTAIKRPSDIRSKLRERMQKGKETAR